MAGLVPAIHVFLLAAATGLGSVREPPGRWPSGSRIRVAARSSRVCEMASHAQAERSPATASAGLSSTCWHKWGHLSGQNVGY
jgi:hypothetical protein